MGFDLYSEKPLNVELATGYYAKFVDMLENGKHWYCEVHHLKRGYIGETDIYGTQVTAQKKAAEFLEKHLIKRRKSNGKTQMANSF